MAIRDRLSSLLSRENKETPAQNTQDAVNEQPKNKDYEIMAGILKKYLGSETEVSIPNNLGITSIGDRAFFRNNNITKVKIPAGITSVGNYSFAGCENLKHVLFPDSLNSVGNYAFENCKNLESFTLPDNVSSIGSYAFSGCENLVSASLPADIKAISNFLFNKCGKLANIKVPSSVTNIGWSAFSGCGSLTFLNLPERLTTIGNNAFQGCGFEKIRIPSYTTSIGEGAFFLCENLEEISFIDQNSNFVIEDGVLFSKSKSKLILYPAKLNNGNTYTIPSSVTSICYGAFSNCESLTEVIIPDSVTKIEGSAFFHCKKLYKIDIPNTVASVGKSCFQKCTSLTEITLPDTLPAIESALFMGCESLSYIELPASINKIGQIAFVGCNSLTSIDIPDSVNSISKDAFSHCNSLKSITIPASVTAIDRGAFSHCPFLTQFNVDENNAEYSTSDGVLYDKEMKTLLSYPNGKMDDTFTIPESVVKINDSAFSGSNNIVSLNIPSTVSVIGNYAFSECIKLTDINIADGITAIGPFTFSKCKNLNLALLPSSIQNIDPSAFVECENLTFFCETSSYSYQYAMNNGIKWSALAPEQVTDLKFVKGTHKTLTLSWRAIPGKVTYSVYVFNEASEKFDFIGKTNNNEITLEELKPGTIYVLRVAACRDFKGTLFPGSPSEDITVSTNPDKVHNLQSQPNTLNSIMLTWDPVKSATEYHIFKHNDETDTYEDIASSRSNKVLITGIVPEYDYQYKVMAYSTFNSLKLAGPFSDVISAGTSVGKITGLRCISATSNSISLLWDEMNDIVSYVVYELDRETNEYVELETTTRNTITFEDLTPGTTYSFKVAVTRIIDKKDVISSPSQPLEVSTALKPVSGAIMASHTFDTIKLNWIKVAGASGYEVHVYNPLSDSYELAGTTDTNYIVFDGLPRKTAFKYKILALCEVNGTIVKGSFSSVVNADTK